MKPVVWKGKNHELANSGRYLVHFLNSLKKHELLQDTTVFQVQALNHSGLGPPEVEVLR